MFWWVLFGFGILCLTGWIIHGVRNRWCDKSYVVGTTLSVVITGALFALAIVLPLQAKSNIAEMKEEKAFIEKNWRCISSNCNGLENTDDFIFSTLIKDTYIQYEFKLSQMKSSQIDYGVLSKYYGMDLSRLDLKLKNNDNIS